MHYTNTPKWILAPLLGAALYTVVGSVIPGPVDELIVGFISIGVAAFKVNEQRLTSKNQQTLPSAKENFDN